MNKARGDFAAEALPGRRVIVMGGETSNGSATGALAWQCDRRLMHHTPPGRLRPPEGIP